MAQSPKGSFKLQFILDNFPEAIIKDAVCADLGCNVGGFTRELLRREAGQVTAIDSGYGTLAWELRQDPRVVVKERSNALHADYLKNIDIIAADLAWTRQEFIIPAAFRYLAPTGTLFSLLKPQYEVPARGKNAVHTILTDAEAEQTAARVFSALRHPPTHSAHLHASPIKGGDGRHGNREFWLTFRPKKIID